MRWSGLRHRTTLLVVGVFTVAVLALFAYASIEPDGIRFGRSPVNRAREEVAAAPAVSPPAAPAPEAVALGIPLDDAALLAPPPPGDDGAAVSLPELGDGFAFPSNEVALQAFAPTSLILRLRTPSTQPPATTPPPTTPPPTTPPPTTPPPTTPPPTTPPPTEPPPTTPPPTEPPPTTPPPTEPPPTEPPTTEPPPDPPLIVIDLPFLPSIPLF